MPRLDHIWPDVTWLCTGGVGSIGGVGGVNIACRHCFVARVDVGLEEEEEGDSVSSCGRASVFIALAV